MKGYLEKLQIFAQILTYYLCYELQNCQIIVLCMKWAIHYRVQNRLQHLVKHSVHVSIDSAMYFCIYVFLLKGATSLYNVIT